VLKKFRISTCGPSKLDFRNSKPDPDLDRCGEKLFSYFRIQFPMDPNPDPRSNVIKKIVDIQLRKSFQQVTELRLRTLKKQVERAQLWLADSVFSER
jgi:hypothetical protein